MAENESSPSSTTPPDSDTSPDKTPDIDPIKRRMQEMDVESLIGGPIGRFPADLTPPYEDLGGRIGRPAEADSPDDEPTT